MWAFEKVPQRLGVGTHLLFKAAGKYEEIMGGKPRGRLFQGTIDSPNIIQLKDSQKHLSVVKPHEGPMHRPRFVMRDWESKQITPERPQGIVFEEQKGIPGVFKATTFFVTGCKHFFYLFFVCMYV
jgi:hypothetical protein